MSDPDQSMLLVEDDEALRGILARAMRQRGFGVAEACSSEDAAAAIHAGLRPSIVVLDLGLPGESGWDFLDRQDLAAAGSPPVIVTSVSWVPPRRLAASGVAAFLQKPFGIESLADAVSKLLAGVAGHRP